MASLKILSKSLEEVFHGSNLEHFKVFMSNGENCKTLRPKCGITFSFLKNTIFELWKPPEPEIVTQSVVNTQLL